jgi:hypothetical protein
MWLGAGILNYSTAPFRVSNTGALVATNANVSGAITASSGSFTGTITSGVNLTTQFGNNINGAANYSGFKIGNTGWENAWIQRSDGSIYFNAQSRNVAPDGTARGVSRLYIDDNNALISFNNGTFSVDYNGAMVASNANITGTVSAGSGNVAGINFSAGRLYSGPYGNWANANTGFYLDLNGYFSLKNKMYFNPDANSGAGELTFTGTLSGASGSVGANFNIGDNLYVGNFVRINGPDASNVTVAKIRGFVNRANSLSNNRFTLVLESPDGENKWALRDDGQMQYWTQSAYSDVRLKSNIQDIDLGLNFINELKPKFYNLNLGKNDEGLEVYRDVKTYGFVAQDIKKTYEKYTDSFDGWALSDPLDPDSLQTISYDNFFAPIVKAIQELSAKVDELESRLV